MNGFAGTRAWRQFLHLWAASPARELDSNGLVCAQLGAILHSGLRHVAGADAAIPLNPRQGRPAAGGALWSPDARALFMGMPGSAPAAEV